MNRLYTTLHNCTPTIHNFAKTKTTFTQLYTTSQIVTKILHNFRQRLKQNKKTTQSSKHCYTNFYTALQHITEPCQNYTKTYNFYKVYKTTRNYTKLHKTEQHFFKQRLYITLHNVTKSSQHYTKL